MLLISGCQDRNGSSFISLFKARIGMLLLDRKNKQFDIIMLAAAC